MHNEYSITKIEGPREALSDLEQQALLEKLIPVTRNGFGTQVKAKDTEKHTLDADVLYLVYFLGEPVGFASFEELALERVSVLYLDGVVLASSHQRKGLLGVVLDRAVAELDGDYIVARTQNPNLYVSLARKCTTLYPRGNAKSPERIKAIAASVVEARRIEGVDPETFVEVGTYGGCMTATVPSYTGRDQEVARAFAEIGLEPERGDSVMLVGEL